MTSTVESMPDRYVAEFLDLAKSANVHFELIDDRLAMRASNPNWEMWRPCRYLLDEIGWKRIAEYLRTVQSLEGSANQQWQGAGLAAQLEPLSFRA